MLFPWFIRLGAWYFETFEFSLIYSLRPFLKATWSQLPLQWILDSYKGGRRFFEGLVWSQFLHYRKRNILHGSYFGLNMPHFGWEQKFNNYFFRWDKLLCIDCNSVNTHEKIENNNFNLLLFKDLYFFPLINVWKA